MSTQLKSGKGLQGNQATDKTEKNQLTAKLEFRDLEQPNDAANYKGEVNNPHADMKMIFRTPIYVIKNADNDIFKLPPSHVSICKAIMLDNSKQNLFIKNVRRSDNGETNMYFVRQLLYKIDKLGFTKAMDNMEKKLAKNASSKEFKAAKLKLTKAAKVVDDLEASKTLARANTMLNEKLTKAARAIYIEIRNKAQKDVDNSKEHAAFVAAKEAFLLLDNKSKKA